MSYSIAILVLLAFCSSAHATIVKEPKVVVIVIDGVRAQEWRGQAKDVSGRVLKTAELFPNIAALKEKSVFFSQMKVSNPAGISLPAYADIFAGRRQEKIINNDPKAEDFKSQYPTIFDVVKTGLKLKENDVALHSSWIKVCPVAGTEKFYRSCGWAPGKYVKPEFYGDSRSDMDTFLGVMRDVPKHHPRFLFVHFADADEEAHYQNTFQEADDFDYGIFNYHKSLRESDHYLGRIWKMLQSDAFYKDSTYLIVTTDHGRDNWPDANSWGSHGRCVSKHGAKELCSGCSSVFAMMTGPGIKANTVPTPQSHIDIAPTIAMLFGVSMPSAVGRPMDYLMSVPTRVGRK